MSPFGTPDWSGDLRGTLDQLRQEVDQLLGRRAVAAPRGTVFPPLNVYETSEGYVLTAELPGMKEEDLDIHVEGTSVSVRGERRIEYGEPDKVGLHRRERPAGFFRRTLELPVPVDPDKCEAAYRNGILMVRLPKAAAHQPRKINIRAS